MKNLKSIFFLALCVGLFSQCDSDEEFSLPGTLPEDPAFSITPFDDDPNKFWVEDLSEGNFVRLWDFGSDAVPKVSSLKRDSVFFPKQGDYDIKLNISAADGSGTASSSQSLNIAENAALGCDGSFALLTEDCTMKCWKLSNEDASVSVGPIPLSGEWFSSTGLEDTQLDDRWCFDAESFDLVYNNNGGSFSACQGFVDDPNYPVPDEIIWEYGTAIGWEGTDRITLVDAEIFIGVEDSGPTYDIISITEDELVLLAPIKPCDGAPSPGWFTLTLIAE